VPCPARRAGASALGFSIVGAIALTSGARSLCKSKVALAGAGREEAKGPRAAGAYAKSGPASEAPDRCTNIAPYFPGLLRPKVALAGG
jgi:hypothetical protein